MSSPTELILQATLMTFLILVALGITILKWRHKEPKNVLIWFLLYPLFGNGILCVLLHINFFTLDWTQTFAFSCLYVLIVICFILMYPAIAQSSLSIDILHQLESGPIKKSKLKRQLQAKSIVSKRIDNLIKAGLLAENENNLTCSNKGKKIAKILMACRQFLGIETVDG